MPAASSVTMSTSCRHLSGARRETAPARFSGQRDNGTSPGPLPGQSRCRAYQEKTFLHLEGGPAHCHTPPCVPQKHIGPNLWQQENFLPTGQMMLGTFLTFPVSRARRLASLAEATQQTRIPPYTAWEDTRRLPVETRRQGKGTPYVNDAHQHANTRAYEA